MKTSLLNYKSILKNRLWKMAVQKTKLKLIQDLKSPYYMPVKFKTIDFHSKISTHELPNLLEGVKSIKIAPDEQFGNVLKPKTFDFSPVFERLMKDGGIFEASLIDRLDAALFPRAENVHIEIHDFIDDIGLGATAYDCGIEGDTLIVKYHIE